MARRSRKLARNWRTDRMRLEHLESRQLLAADTATLVDDQFSVHQNSSPIALDVLANDLFGAEYAGAKQISAVSYGSQGGRIEVDPDRRSLTYAPPADYAGSEQFSYFVDGQYFATATVQIQPALRDDQYKLPPDGQVHTLNVMDNDPFWGGYTGDRRITMVSVTSGESEVQIGPDGRSLLYRPTELASGVDQFLYIVDGHYPARVSVSTVAALESDQYEVLEQATQQPLNVLTNDPFWNQYSGERKITHVSNSSSGATVEISANGNSLLYTPADDAPGYDSFYYTVDGRFETLVSINVVRPVQDDYHEIDRNSRDFFIDVLSNDRYYSSIQRRYVDVVNRVTSAGTSAEGGSVSVAPDGRGLVYTAPRDFFGQDTLTYVADGRYEATVNINIARPVRDDYLSVYQDTPDQRLDVLENDFVGNGYDGARQLTGVTASQEGIVPEIQGSVIVYTPPTEFTGRDSLSYTVDDALGADVSIDVIPLAQYDHYSFCTQPNQALSLSVLNNDHFRRGYTGPGRIDSAQILDGGGQVSISADGHSLTYEPGSTTYARIQYVVDGKYAADVSVSRENRLASDHLVVDQNTHTTSIDVLENDFDHRWDRCESTYTGQRRVTGVVPSENGATVTVAADGRTVSYQPAEDFTGQDHFTYVVDGAMEQTVYVQVVRRVRDDAVRTQPGQAEALEVLTNDLFGADYAGAQRITHVTASSIGANVQISPDGRQILYEAPADFIGTDQLTYTVDGRLKAHVEVAVRQDGVGAYDTFGSLDQFQQFLIDDALDRYEHLFGQPAYHYFAEDFDTAGNPTLEPTAERDHSETNVQVAGIDEGDIVEFDANYVYFLTGRDLVILNAWPAEQLHEVSRTEIVGEPIAQYLNGDRLTVVSQIVTWSDPYGPMGDVAIDSIRPVDFFPWRPASYETITTVLDVSDRANPRQVQQTTFEGRYVQSRGIGDFVYLALSNQAVAPEPRIIPDGEWTEDTPIWDRTGTYETREEYLARVQANLGEFVDEALPNYQSSGPDGQLVRSGLLHEPEDIFVPLSEGVSSLVSLVSINVKNNEPGITESSGVFTSGATQVYASLNHFYIFEQGYAVEDGNVTRILQFDWDDVDGSARFSSSGVVPGYMLNQFSADEYNDHLRIATTVSHSYSGNWTSVSENDLFVLRDDGGILEFTGSLQNLGLNETTRSVRFMGPRAFVVTFRNVDPLFGLDVSDPSNPRSIGHLTLPGFSSYMQFVDDNHLLTVGRNTPNGVAGPAQVSLFDVSDLSQPTMVDEYTMERFSFSEATVDHHAFGFYGRHGLLAVPSSRSYVERTDEDGDGYAEQRNWQTEYELMVFRIDTDAQPGSDQGVVLVAEITHDSPVRRSGYIGDKLFSVADDSIHVTDIAEPTTILATAADLHRPIDPAPIPFPEPFEMAEALRSAQLDISQRLNLASGAAVPVVAERSANGWNTVVRVDETYFRYETDGEETRLTEVDYQFSTAGDAVSWQNSAMPADINGDGEVSLGDATLLIHFLNGDDSRDLSRQRVLRQIGDPSADAHGRWDVDGDGVASTLDVMAIIGQFNRASPLQIDFGSLDPSDPSSLHDAVAVDAFYDRVTQHAGDANLDGVFDSADLIEIFQRGQYEDSENNNSTWRTGDWDGDGDFTSADLVLAFSRGLYVWE